MQPLLEINALQKQIDDFKLGPIDLQIEPGTITAMIGNNGSGKSTLLKLLIHLAKADEGTIMIAGQPVSGKDERWKTQVAYQPQTIIGYNAFTGEALRDLISHWYPNWDKALFRKMTDLFDIPMNKRFGKLSQGTQQKLNLALTIARNTPILILDEPTTFMDLPSKRILMDLLTDWMEQGEQRAIIIASHQAEDIRKLADYLFIIRYGKMLGYFEKEELTEHYKHYWLQELPDDNIPGEVSREGSSIISNQPEETETCLRNGQIPWKHLPALELDEIITLLLEGKRGRSF